MTSQTAREALIEELLSAWPYGEDIAGVGEHYICAAILPLIARIEAEALARGRLEGAKAMQDQLVQHVFCHADRIRILALDSAAIVQQLSTGEST